MTSSNLQWISEGARKNPEGLLLLAAGAILLMRGKTKSRAAPLKQKNNSYGDYYDGRYGSRSGQDDNRYGQSENDRQARGAISRAGNAAKDYASDVRDYAAEVRDTVTEAAGEYASSAASTAGEYASAVQGYVGDAGRAIADRSGEYAQRAQRTFQHGVDRVLQDQPLAIALAGFAAGAAVAAAFPVSSFERENLGGIGGQLNDAAEEGKRMLCTAARAAREEIEKVASDKGLTAEGLKEAAREVTGAVESSLSSKSDKASASAPSQSSGQSAQPSSSGQSGNTNQMRRPGN